MSFVIVEFISERSVYVVPRCWIETKDSVSVMNEHNCGSDRSSESDSKSNQLF